MARKNKTRQKIRVSEHITLEEATKSVTAKGKGIDNTPDEKTLEVMKQTAEILFEPLRRFWGVPIYVSSMFRSPELNEAIGGSKTSDHMKGRAIDLDAHVYGHISNRQIFEYLRDHVDYDQLIWEFGNADEPDWVHVSYRGDENRRQKLMAYKSGGKTKYKFI